MLQETTAACPFRSTSQALPVDIYLIHVAQILHMMSQAPTTTSAAQHLKSLPRSLHRKQLTSNQRGGWGLPKELQAEVHEERHCGPMSVPWEKGSSAWFFRGAGWARLSLGLSGHQLGEDQADGGTQGLHFKKPGLSGHSSHIISAAGGHCSQCACGPEEHGQPVLRQQVLYHRRTHSAQQCAAQHATSDKVCLGQHMSHCEQRRNEECLVTFAKERSPVVRCSNAQDVLCG